MSLAGSRVRAQLLDAPLNGIEEVVRHLVGVQAQVPSAAGLALRARTSGRVAADVRRAWLEERSIARAWCMRGTLHYVCADDAAWLVALIGPTFASRGVARLTQMGISAAEVERALALIPEWLAGEPPLGRSQIEERLLRAGIPAEGQVAYHLIWQCAARGVVCITGERSGKPLFGLARDWLPPAPPRGPDAALAELARRYRASHLPAEPVDLAAWSGLPLTAARRAWQLAGDPPAPPRTRARRSPHVRLLGDFDDYLLGWKDRTFAVPPERLRDVNRGGGWLNPVVLVDGRVAATWKRADIDWFSPPTDAVLRGVAAERADIARFTGMPGPKSGVSRNTSQGCTS